MVSNSYNILSPPVVTRIMQESQEAITLPMQLLWEPRAAMPDVSDQEMTMKERTEIYAADVITADSEALVREAGQFNFVQFGSNKLKHGYAINESMIKTLRRLSMGKAMDNEYLAFDRYLARCAAALVLGSRQRIESMINGMLVDGYHYDRLGIRIDAKFGMPNDLKINPVASWRNADGTVNVNAKPITDIINALMYALRTYSEAYNRVTLSYSALLAIVGTTEFKELYKAQGDDYKYAQSSDAPISARSNAPGFYLPFISNFISAALQQSTDPAGTTPGRAIKFEMNEGQFREYSSQVKQKAPVPFHPGAGNIIFTNSDDDNSSQGWDCGNGECIETLLINMGGHAIIGRFDDSVNPFGPIGYMTPQNVHANPPGLVIWHTRWTAPRKHRDTCSMVLRAWTNN